MLVTLALKVNSLVGIERAPASLGVVAGIGALLAMVGNPFFGKMSDRTSSRRGMRRLWMIIGLAGGSLGILVVALAPSILVVLVGWCMAQLFFNALLAAQVAVLTRHVQAIGRPASVDRSSDLYVYVWIRWVPPRCEPERRVAVATPSVLACPDWAPRLKEIF